jgi:hypothetical protein
LTSYKRQSYGLARFGTFFFELGKISPHKVLDIRTAAFDARDSSPAQASRAADDLVKNSCTAISTVVALSFRHEVCMLSIEENRIPRVAVLRIAFARFQIQY